VQILTRLRLSRKQLPGEGIASFIYSYQIYRYDWYKSEAEMKNEVAKLLKTVAWISFVLGTLAALILLVTSSVTNALICWAASFVAGAVVLGLSEIIHLLQLGFSEIVPLLEETRDRVPGK
jgi:hypothetical protein